MEQSDHGRLRACAYIPSEQRTQRPIQREGNDAARHSAAEGIVGVDVIGFVFEYVIVDLFVVLFVEGTDYL